MQVLIQGLTAALGSALVPMDSPAVLEGLIEVPRDVEISMLQKISFVTPSFKVCLR